MHALCYSSGTDQSRRGAHTAAQKVVALDHALLIPRLIVVQTTGAQIAQDMRGGGLVLERAQDQQVARSVTTSRAIISSGEPYGGSTP